MSDLANLLRVTAKEMAEHDEPPSWHHQIVEAADEIEKLRAALQWLLNDLQDYPASARPIAAYDNARAALGEKE